MDNKLNCLEIYIPLKISPADMKKREQSFAPFRPPQGRASGLAIALNPPGPALKPLRPYPLL